MSKHSWLLPIAALIISTLLPPSSSRAEFPTAYHVELHKQLNDHAGVNDCWGYTAPDGTELAIYGHQVGTAFVDATDPANATELFNLPGPSSPWRDIKTYLHYAYIVTEGPGPGTGLQIVDLTDPLQPVHVNTYTGGGLQTSHNLWIDTGAAVAYCCGSTAGGMHILSLADPENPVEIGFFGNYYIHDLYVADGRAYAGAITSQTLRILDVTNPANPITLATHGYPGAQTHNAWPTSSGTYCITTDETTGGHIKIWDIANLSNISLASEWEVGTQSAIVHNALLKNDLAYVSYYTAGARILDVTDPTDPIEVGYYDTSTRNSGFDGDWGVYPFRGDDVFYASDRQEGLFILEFSGGYAGQISGTIRDASTLLPLESATVFVDAFTSKESDGSGAYGARVAGGSYPVVVSKYGFAPDTSLVIVPEQGAVVHDVNLTPLPAGDLALHVTAAANGDPVAGAFVELLGAPEMALVTDGNGDVTISDVPAGIPWTVRVAKFGFAVESVPVSSVQGVTTNRAIELATGFSDDFEVDQAWIVGDAGDDATGGIWERAIPVGSSYLGPVAPSEDSTPYGAGFAFITEQHVPGTFAGSSDVDGGHTTLSSPVFDATGLGSIQLEYRRWFSNRAPTPDQDEFRADVSTDGGGSWTNLETIDVGTDTWAEVSIDLSAIVTPTATMQLRFVAADTNAETFVEAGIDDLHFVTAATGIVPGTTEVTALEFSNAFPNPFREGTTLSFELPRSGPVELSIYDVTGRRVTTLLSASRLAAGAHRVSWDGRDARGSVATPGVYFARLRGSGLEASRKLIRIR